jgi:HD-GYP domain-containing protein (c-di-GMP phosphodiesterase class II)
MKKKDPPNTENVFSIPQLVTNIALMNLTEKVNNFEKEKKETYEMAARSILLALDMKDSYTFGHSTRVAFYSKQVGMEMGLSQEELYQLELASLFHDIGKIGVPDSILLKPGRLDKEEFDVMKTHPGRSEEILSSFIPFKDIAKYARHHHERYDGKGYPDHLKGENIPYFSRIILISDTFDAMTSTRPYRDGLPYNVAFSELIEFAGSQFDPKLSNYFIKAMEKDEKKKEHLFNLTIIQGEFSKKAA